jgi:DNA-binding response OmpR family regulator
MNEKQLHKGTVLVIEDEPAVMETVQLLLKKFGWHVIAAETGAKALRIVSESSGSIDMALLDISLPDMDGRDLFPMLRERDPELNVIVSSGRPLDHSVQAVLDAGAQSFLQKPYLMSELSEQIRLVVDGTLAG